MAIILFGADRSAFNVNEAALPLLGPEASHGELRRYLYLIQVHGLKYIVLCPSKPRNGPDVPLGPLGCASSMTLLGPWTPRTCQYSTEPIIGCVDEAPY